ncbi:hypothetical protein [Shinella granuli]|uniref:Uncharacterized protein n=1 Tax=Shinella granuli TaxID=323621 RepID=A0A4R2CSD9_SHIGR|nr:hypothetical protein [Shinella granuli]TCN42414.1 hypothetical protein EV665_112149 [Shinella granuli]
MTEELVQAEADLDAFEAELWRRIGLDPDGSPDAYLNEAQLQATAKLERLRDRVSLLRSEAA